MKELHFQRRESHISELLRRISHSAIQREVVLWFVGFVSCYRRETDPFLQLRKAMFKNSPLTWLFLLATVSLDVAMLSQNASEVTGTWPSFSFAMFNFLVPAQLSVLALWAALGNGTQLTRAAIMTVLGSLLIYIVRENLNEEARPLVVSDYSVHILLVFGVASLCRSLAWTHSLDEQLQESPEPTLGQRQFSLMEFFAWTILVALWAFILRYAAIQETSSDKYWWYWWMSSVAIPAIMLPLIFRRQPAGTRILRIMVIYLLVFLVYGVARFVLGYNFSLLLWIFLMAITQITYISAWWAVLRMDAVMLERRGVSQHSREALALFRPDEQEHPEGS